MKCGQDANTRHDGSLSTGHANSARDMLKRLETMVLMGMEIPLLAIRQQIEASVDIIIHLSRLRDCSRKVVDICEVAGMEDGEIVLNTLFEFAENERQKEKVVGALYKMNDLIHIDKLLRAGLEKEYQEANSEVPCVSL